MVLKHVVSIGAAIVFGLLIFAAMQLMVATDGMFEKPDRNQTYLNFVRVDTSSQDVATKDRRLPDPPPPPETPPPATPDNALSNSFDSATASLSMNMPNIGMGINQGEGPALGTMQVGNGMAGFDTDVIPMVRVPPAYPQRAKQAKLEGYVTMAVTIRPDGTVADVDAGMTTVAATGVAVGVGGEAVVLATVGVAVGADGGDVLAQAVAK